MEHTKAKLVIFTLIIGGVSHAADQSSPAQFRNRHVIQGNRRTRSIDLVREQPLSDETRAWIEELKQSQKTSTSEYTKRMIGALIFKANSTAQIDVQEERERLAQLLQKAETSEKLINVYSIKSQESI